MIARRLRPEGVMPLEVWERMLGGVPAWQRIGAGRFTDARALAADVLALAKRTVTFDALYLGGGLAADPAVRAALQGQRVVFARDAVFVAESGGLALGADTVVDVGQTAVKVSRRGARASHPWESPGSLDWLADLLAQAHTGGRLVLALPCELDDDMVPGACSFPGWHGDAGLVARLVDALPGQGLVLNDAELAALSARAELPKGTGRVLVMTLGFGPGAARVVI